MEALYHWVGLFIVWAILGGTATAAVCFLAWAGWHYLLAKINTTKWPWALWGAYYVRRTLGQYRYHVNELQPPFLYNREGFRGPTKEKMPTVRDLQANIIRYNRRRWARRAAY